MDICGATGIRNTSNGDRTKVSRYHLGLRYSSNKMLCTMTLFHIICIRCVNELLYGGDYEFTVPLCRATIFVAMLTMRYDAYQASNLECGFASSSRAR